MATTKHKNLPYPICYCYTLLLALFFTTYPFFVMKFGIIAMVYTAITFQLLALIDYFTSEATMINWRTIKKNGFSNGKLLYCWISTGLTWWVFPCVCVYIYTDYIEPRYTLDVILKLIGMLSVAEITFFTGHIILHRYLPEIHKLHHCCKTSSYTTGIMFEPLDIIIEFVPPNVVPALICIWMGDYWIMTLTFSAISTWYALDHDEYLQSAHSKHHKYINSAYFAYLPFSQYDSKDKVRSIVKS